MANKIIIKHSPDELTAYIHLALTPNVGPKIFQLLAEIGIQAGEIYKCSADQLTSLKLSKKSIKHILAYPPSNPSKDAEQALNWAQPANNHLITCYHKHYPQRLMQITSAPPILMVMGELACLDLPQIAIVGSRYPSLSGQSQAFEFAQSLVESGFVITSGLARGIDAFAHKGALQAGGKTIAVMGTGLSQIYPKQNQRLAAEIAEQGAVVSEFPLRAKAMPGHFPRRNRIVSGLSMGTLVVEATIKSGSLITARQALEQNREVFAIPGPINNPQKSGCHYLIRQGASLIETPDQIVQELSLMHPRQQPVNRISADANKLSVETLPNNVLDQLKPEQYKILKAVDYQGVNLDDLVMRTQYSVAEISVHLMDLELSGLIRQDQGAYFRL
jgi:DNA processing protein